MTTYKLPTLEHLAPKTYEPLAFPKFQELVLQDAMKLTEEKPRSPTGLFHVLVGDPKLLLADVQEHPAKYPEGSEHLLLELAQGRVPTAAEEEELNKLTHYFATAATPKQTPPPKQVEAPRKRMTRDSEEQELQPFWWL